MRTNLIFSRKADNTAMTAEDIMSRAPAVFNGTKAERLTDRYAVFTTSSLLPILADYGYMPVQAAQKKVNKNSKVTLEQKSHMLAFSHVSDLAKTDTVESRQEIIFYNSHDGTGSLQLFAGNFRFICSNGIIRGQGHSQRIYHSAKSLSGFEDALKKIISDLPAIQDRLNNAKGIILTREQETQMAINAAKARWDWLVGAPVDVEGKVKVGSYASPEVTIPSILRATRPEDTGIDAYTAWNKIQENVLRGNAFIHSISAKGVNPSRKARPITAVGEHLAVNQKLFELLPA